MTRRVRSVAIVGRDAPAWLAAAALQRALGRTGLIVRVVEQASRLTPADVYATVPSAGSMHQLLGLDEGAVLRFCDALPMVAQRFSNWAKGAAPYFIAYDDEVPHGTDLSFTEYWAKAALEGLRVGLEEFSLGTLCARLNNVPVRSSEEMPLMASYGYHLDARRYSQMAKQIATQLGVESVSAEVRNVDVDGDRITGVDLSNGDRITADLYIDASGPEARLIGQLPDAEFESWAEWLPCDRMMVASAPKLPTLPAFSQISAFNHGWVGLFPLQSRTAVVAAYSSRDIGDAEVAEIVPPIARLPISGGAVVSELRRGSQRKPWTGNCVAIGQAAISVDPLDALDIHVAHGCISHLIGVFPATADEFPEAEAFNKSVRSFGANLRDFQSAHYLLNRRFDDPFWDRTREAASPASLRRKIDMFDARALIPMNDDESFDEQSWAALLLGCGVTPKGYDPRVDALPDELHIQKIQERLRDAARLAKSMPSLDQFLGLDQQSRAELSGENATA